MVIMETVLVQEMSIKILTLGVGLGQMMLIHGKVEQVVIGPQAPTGEAVVYQPVMKEYGLDNLMAQIIH